MVRILMKCLSVWAPWSLAFFDFGKLVENRGWWTSYRGPLLIHSSLKVDEASWKAFQEICPTFKQFREFPRGVILGRVTLVDCVRVASVGRYLQTDREIRWAFGPFCWIFQNPHKFRTPIRYRGAQGLFEVPYEIYREAA
jgi:hypothetical protein